jgi:hypothetical protein
MELSTKRDAAMETVAAFNLDEAIETMAPPNRVWAFYLGTLQRAFRPWRKKTAPVRLTMPSQ